ncbi:MAG: hypothetical protein IPN73_00310 [Saprospiraceae bacterium]|nr:hypothetical protein [Saprospiraceae bacterium]
MSKELTGLFTILAPNHRLPLSGNKLWLWAFLLFIVACSPAAKLTKTEVKKLPENQEVTKADSLATKKAEESADPSKNKMEEIEVIGEKKADSLPTPAKQYSHYDVAVVLPFSETAGNERFLQYYGGMKLAAEELALEGHDFTIRVYNAEESGVLDQLEQDNSKLIFAPSDENLLKKMVDLGKSKNATVISPFFSLSTVENAPSFIQLKPSLKSHFSSITTHVLSNYNANEVVLVGRNTKADKAWFKYFQATAAEISGQPLEKIFSEYWVLDDSLSLGSRVFYDLIESGKNVFIFPNYSYKDELYLYNAMRRLLAEKGSYPVTVYGMPIIKDSEKMGFDFFSGLNVHVPASRYVEEFREEVKSFDRKFFDHFGALPETDAYEGFDHMLFIGRHLSEYGESFAPYLSTDTGQYLHSKFDVRAAHTEGSASEIDYFENKYLEILRFDGTRFVKAY